MFFFLFFFCNAIGTDVSQYYVQYNYSATGWSHFGLPAHTSLWLSAVLGCIQ